MIKILRKRKKVKKQCVCHIKVIGYGKINSKSIKTRKMFCCKIVE